MFESRKSQINVNLSALSKHILHDNVFGLPLRTCVTQVQLYPAVQSEITNQRQLRPLPATITTEPRGYVTEYFRFLIMSRRTAFLFSFPKVHSLYKDELIHSCLNYNKLHKKKQNKTKKKKKKNKKKKTQHQTLDRTLDT